MKTFSFATLTALLSQTADAIASNRRAGEITFSDDERPGAPESHLNTSDFDDLWPWVGSSLVMPMPFESDRGNLFEDPLFHITCSGGKTMAVPRSAILLENNGKKALWCPNAKVGTSTVFALMAELLGKGFVTDSKSRREGQKLSASKLVKSGHEALLCDANFSFTAIRNPWDRVLSAYVDKVNTQVFVPHDKHATFGKFLHAIQDSPPEYMNAHWMPAVTRCAIAGPKKFSYSRIYKIEQNFEESLAEVFAQIGIPEKRSLAALKRIGTQNSRVKDHSTTARLEARHTAYRDPALRRIISRLYREDIATGHYDFIS